MPRVLLLMTANTYRASDFLAAAERLGVRVTVGTDRPNVLENVVPGSALTLDFFDPKRAAGAIQAFAEAYPIEAVVAVDDDTVPLAAAASKALGLKSNPVEAAFAVRSKYQTRQILEEDGLPSPGFRLLSVEDSPEALARTVPYPCVLKPTFLAASRGVIRADDPEEFAAAFRRITAILREPETAARGGDEAGMILAEDYIPGKEVALEGILQGGELRVLALFDKPDPMEGPYFEETIYVTPSRLPDETQEAITDTAARALRALGIGEGPVHVELRVNEGGAWVIDVAARSIGGRCSRALRFEGDASLEGLILGRALGREAPAAGRVEGTSGVMMIPIPGAGILRGVEGKEEALAVEGVEEVEVTIHPGGRVLPLPEGDRYLGFIFARGEAPEKVEAALRTALDRLRFRIEPE